MGIVLQRPQRARIRGTDLAHQARVVGALDSRGCRAHYGRLARRPRSPRWSRRVHPEPRSLLGYHEFARARRAAALRGARVRARRRSRSRSAGKTTTQSVAELKQLHELGLFEGQHSVPPAARCRTGCGCAIAPAAQALKHDTYFFSHELSEFDLICSARAALAALPQVRRAPRRARRRRRHAFCGVGAECQARERGRRFNLWDGRKHAMQARGGSGVWELFVPGVGEGAEYKYEIRTQRRSHDAQVRSVRLSHAAAARKPLGRHDARRLCVAATTNGSRRARSATGAARRSTSTKCTCRAGGTPGIASRRSTAGRKRPTS